MHFYDSSNMGLNERLSKNNRKIMQNARTGTCNHSVICIDVNHSIFQIQNLASHILFLGIVPCTVIEETAVIHFTANLNLYEHSVNM